MAKKRSMKTRARAAQDKEKEKRAESPPRAGKFARLAHSEIAKTLLAGLAIVVIIAALVAYAIISAKRPPRESAATDAKPIEPPAASRQLPAFRVANGHEHLYLRAHLDKYLAAAERTGIARTLFVASSEYTLKGKKSSPAAGNERNTEEILRAAKEFPGKIVPFCTLHPDDPDKVELIKRYVAEGVKGIKLYTGHGNFYDRPLDAAEMLPVYEYCEQTRLPICWHVNMPKYADEFRRVMQRYPNLIVILPHFGQYFYTPESPGFAEFQQLLDAYPGLYTDTSFGTRDILVAGLEKLGGHRDIFRAFCEKYSDRILFGTDMVITGNKEKTADWIASIIQACRDALEQDRYIFAMAAAGSRYASAYSKNTLGELRGLALSEDVLRKIYETNFERLFPSADTPQPAPESGSDSE